MYQKNNPKPFNKNTSPKDTSWEKVSDWYNEKTGDKGHYFQEKVIVPKSLKLLKLGVDSSVMDLACGQGIFSRKLPANIKYLGVDLSESLIKNAIERNNRPSFKFEVGDITEKLPMSDYKFTHSIIILALQNVEDYDAVFRNVSANLKINGKFLIIINHPYYRIPRQSAWGIDDQNKMQYRRVNRYMSALKIPINMTPGQSSSKLTWSFHNPLSAYSESLNNNGFVIEKIEEWVSPKVSEGSASKMENMARDEFPMFMAILASKTKEQASGV